MSFKYTHDEMREAVELLFDNLDWSKFNDEIVPVTFDAFFGFEPNEVFKNTVEDQISYLNDVLSYMLDLLE